MKYEWGKGNVMWTIGFPLFEKDGFFMKLEVSLLRLLFKPFEQVQPNYHCGPVFYTHNRKKLDSPKYGVLTGVLALRAHPITGVARRAKTGCALLFEHSKDTH
jgi:hypothetical protein